MISSIATEVTTPSHMMLRLRHEIEARIAETDMASKEADTILAGGSILREKAN